MKHLYYTYLFVILMSMAWVQVYAHDFEMMNSDGVTIYYNYTGGSTGSSVYVTYRGTHYYSYSNEYSGNVAIPKTVTYNSKTYSVAGIGDYAFYGCSGLTSITIPNSVTNIGDYAFYGCSGLTSVTIPNSVTNIGDYAFDGCSGLTSIIIPNSVTSIGSGAFFNTRIKSLTIGTGIQTIGSDAFSYNSSSAAKPIKVIWLANTPPSGYKNVGGTIKYVPNNSYSGLSNTKIYPFLSSMFEVDGIKYVPVDLTNRTCVAVDCVYDGGLYDAYIGKNVSYQGIDLSVTGINDYIFYNCTNLKSATIEADITTINEDAFRGCTNLTSVTIPQSITTLSINAFSGCTNISTVNWNAKNAVDFSSPGPFSESCTKIENFNFGDSVQKVPAYLCLKMSKLNSVNIPDETMTISDNAFNGCSNLREVTLGANLRKIGSSVFSGCTEITNITSHASNPPTCISGNMSDINKWNCTLYVPYSSIDYYKTAKEWSTFFYIKPILSSYNLGDANGDNLIDVADFTAIASYILGNKPETFVDVAADVNSDLAINVADITGVSNIILYGSLTSAASAKAVTIGGKESIKSVIQAEDFTINAGEEHTIDIEIENLTTQFSAYQFDMHLPDGIKVKNVALGNDRTNAQKTNYLDFAELSDGITRVICASTKDIAFTGTEGTVARVTLVADNNIKAGNYSVGIDNVILSQAGQSEMPESITFNANVSKATGITETQSEDINKRNVMYDIMGRKMNNSPRHGIYIMNGKKIIK
ncbi:MAG: leucine-rich repeat protein [Prevotella sp.]|nr:leucine-rich repeat protein [Prevotella sp.]